MSEMPRQEDVYEQTDALSDFSNELSSVYINEAGEIERFGTIRTVEERYEALAGIQVNDIRLKAIEEHPEKVARINKLVEMINATTDPIFLKRAVNEVRRLTQGSRYRSYGEPEADPDLLEI